MAREEQGAGPSKQEEALKRYMDDSLRRCEERQHANTRPKTPDVRAKTPDVRPKTIPCVQGAK